MAYLGNLAAWLDKILGSFTGATINGKTITLTKHSGDTVTLTTQDTVYTHPTTAGNKHIPAGGASGNILRWKAAGEAEWGSELDPVYVDATTTTHGLMSAADKSKLDGVASGAEVNQNAYSNVKVGTTTVAADSKTDTLELVAGNNITITPDATNDKITIAATQYTHPAYTSRTGKPTANATPGFGGTVTISQITSDASGHVTAATDRTITIPSAVASSSANGLMSSTDKAAFDAMKTALNGGTTGQVLVKTASGYGWSDLVNIDVNPSGDE